MIEARSRIHISFSTIAIIMLMMYGNYNAILSHFLGAMGLYAFILIPFILVFFENMVCYRGKLLLGYSKRNYIPYFIMAMWCLLNDWAIRYRDLHMPVRIIICTLTAVLLTNTKKWTEKLLRISIIIGLPNALSTLIYWIIPDIYSPITRFLQGSLPARASLGYTSGYAAGLADHYSKNGSFIVYCTLAIWVAIIKKQGNSKIMKLFLAINLFAILLTTKRAHLLFCVIAMVVIYFIENPHKLTKRVIRTGVMSVVGIVVVAYMSTRIPAIQSTIQRLERIGTTEDVSMGTRFQMWGAAIEWFKQKPLFGNGFFYFRYNFRYIDRFSRIINSHSVYVQMLCETGLVGTSIFVIGEFLMLIHTIKVYIKSRQMHFANALLLSVAFQIFVMLYQFTGNCYYDIVFCNYAIAIAVPGSILFQARKGTITEV